MKSSCLKDGEATHGKEFFNEKGWSALSFLVTLIHRVAGEKLS
jgi:hypothetical protein